MTRARENGATTGAGVLATYAYDSRGRRLSLTRGNGTVQTYGYDPVSRLARLGDALPGASHDRTVGFTYNPAGQIASTTRSNDLFSFTGHANGSLLTPVNGRNRITSITDEEGSEITSYDARGNMTGDGTSDYSYNSLNQLTGRREPGSAATVTANPSLAYDPLGRLYRYTASGVVRRFGYDGDAMIAEYTSANAVSRRYVHGAGIDEPLVQYDGAGTATRRWLHADERGSIVARSDDNGAVDHVNTYDEYGVPGEGNVGRFGYTGQVWLPELGLYYYRARIYNPELGRFMQADPIGYGDGLNLYAYAGSDPVNFSDPSGTTVQIGNLTCPKSAVFGGESWQCVDTGTQHEPFTYFDPTPYMPFNPPFGSLPYDDVSAFGRGSGLGGRVEPGLVVQASICREVSSHPLKSSNSFILAAHTRFGDTFGNNPQNAGSRINTDVPGDAGDFFEAYAYYWAVNIRAKSLFGHIPGPAGSPIILMATNGIALRRSTTPGDDRYRIDIPAGVLNLSRRETIHVGTRGSNQCPAPTT